MKKKLLRLTAFALALCLLTTAAVAASFTDTGSHWAKSYIADLADRGVFNGYTDGTFRPENNVTTVEVLVSLSRLCMLDESVAELVYADHKDELTTLMGTDLAWAHDEFAVCLETGIITKTELEALYRAKSLDVAATKELVAVFLTRAMQMEDETQALGAYTLPFKDTSDILASRKPYVYTLYKIGVITGDTSGNFLPKNNVKRSEVAAMLSRALTYMEEHGITVSLPAYESGKAIAGSVTSVSTTGSTLTIALSDLSATPRIVSALTSTPVYLNGVSGVSGDIVSGRYLEACYNDNNVLTALRVYTDTQTVTGDIQSITEKQLKIKDGTGISRTLATTPRTQVATPTTTGDRTLMSASADYESAVCLISGSTLLTVRLSGGTYEVRGVLSSINLSKKTATFTDLEGYSMNISLPESVSVQAASGSTSSALMSESYAGCLATVRFAEEDDSITSLTITPSVTVKQGSVKSTSPTSTPPAIYLTALTGSASNGYDLMLQGTKVYYKDEEIAFNKLDYGSFATLLVSSKQVTHIYAYPGQTEFKGSITGLNYGAVITLTITNEDGASRIFTLDPDDLPAIYRGDSATTITKLAIGDKATVELKYNQIKRIVTAAEDASVIGTITRITMEVGGNAITLTDEDGESQEYTIADNASVIQGNNTLTLSDLKIGYSVGLVIKAGIVTSIEIQGTSAAITQIEGTVLYVNSGDGSLLVEVNGTSGKTNLTVTLVSGGRVVDSVSGNTLYTRGLNVLDEIVAMGYYNGTQFSATVIIRK